MKVGTASAIGNDGRINDLATTNTLPGLEGANIVIKFFGIHFSFALGTFHCLVLHGCDYKHRWRWFLIACCHGYCSSCMPKALYRRKNNLIFFFVFFQQVGQDKDLFKGKDHSFISCISAILMTAYYWKTLLHRRVNLRNLNFPPIDMRNHIIYQPLKTLNSAFKKKRH